MAATGNKRCPTTVSSTVVMPLVAIRVPDGALLEFPVRLFLDGRVPSWGLRGQVSASLLVRHTAPGVGVRLNQQSDRTGLSRFAASTQLLGRSVTRQASQQGGDLGLADDRVGLGPLQHRRNALLATDDRLKQPFNRS